MKKLLIFLGVFIIFATIPVVIYFVQQNTELRSKAAPATTLTLSPASITKSVGDSFVADILISTGGNNIASVDLILTYDPAVLTASDITAGSFLTGTTEIQKNINSSAGKITYSFYTSKANAKSGDGTLATVSFSGKAGGTSTVQFDQNATVLYGLQETQNVWTKNQAPATYTIAGGSSATPSPTPPPDSGITPTPTTPPALPTDTPPVNPPTATPTTAATATYAFAITYPVNGSVVTTGTPTIRGTATPGGTVTVVITGTSNITGVVSVDTGGTWRYVVPEKLVDGSYTITATEQPPTGAGRTSTITFTIQTSRLPRTGASNTTWLLTAGGTLLLFLGLTLAL